jgi:membrane fusion protein, copper/silver efflux system
MKRLVVGLAVVVLLAAAGGLVVLRRPAVETASPAPRTLYQCAMHPQIVSDRPGVCPICGMRLQPVGEPSAATSEGGVPGHAAFTLSPERQQLIGVRTEAVERRPLAIEIRTAGRVAYDPGLYQALVEYREALRARGALSAATLREAREGADGLVRAAALRLRQQGISETQIRELTADGRDPLNLLLPGKSVWVYAQVFESEMELVHPGQEIVVTVPSLPGRVYRARLVAIDAILDPATRTARVRALVATPDESLRPESFVHVEIHVPLGDRIAVPENAVLDTGQRQIVFVVQDDGRFEPRAVQLGREAEGYREVLGGVEAGERVVTSANFLIDSESRFRSALAAFGGTPAGVHVH